MKVGLIGRTDPDLFGWHIVQTLPSLGCEVVPLGTPRLTSRSRDLTNALSLVTRGRWVQDRWVSRIVDRAIDHGLDLLLTLGDNLTRESVNRLRAAGVRTALWHPDAVSNHGRMGYAMAGHDALFLTDPVLVRRLRAVLRARALYLPEACNPAVHRPAGQAASTPAVVMAGNTYPSRLRLLEQLVDEHIPLHLYGAPLPRTAASPAVVALHRGHPIWGPEKARVFREAAAVLNNLHPAENGVNARLFEATGSGAAVLVEERQCLPDLYEPGTEVVTFRDFDGLLARCRELLSEPEMARSIGDAATRRAHRDHTYYDRLSRLLEEVM